MLSVFLRKRIRRKCLPFVCAHCRVQYADRTLRVVYEVPRLVRCTLAESDYNQNLNRRPDRTSSDVGAELPSRPTDIAVDDSDTL